MRGQGLSSLTRPTFTDLQHNLWLLTLRGALGLSPKIEHGAKRVLDVGTGTGIWAVEYGACMIVTECLVRAGACG